MNLCRHGHDKGVVGTLPNGYCRECTRVNNRKYYASDKGRMRNRISSRRYYSQNRQKKLDRVARYAKTHPDRIAVKRAREHARHRAAGGKGQYFWQREAKNSL